MQSEQTMRVALLEDEPIQMQLMVATLETFSEADHEAINCSQFKPANRFAPRSLPIRSTW